MIYCIILSTHTTEKILSCLTKFYQHTQHIADSILCLLTRLLTLEPTLNNKPLSSLSHHLFHVPWWHFWQRAFKFCDCQETKEGLLCVDWPILPRGLKFLWEQNL